MIRSALFARPSMCRLPLALSCAVIGSAATGSVGVDTSALLEAVTAANARVHLEAFEAIADANGGDFVAGSDAHLDAALYVAERMSAAGYDVDLQIFPFVYFDSRSPAVLARLSPEPLEFAPETLDGFTAAQFSASGDVTAALTPVDLTLPPTPEENGSTSGCEVEDFAAFPPGDIALVQRGGCSFADKVVNAEAAGAVGVVIFNEGQEGRRDAEIAILGEEADVGVPVVFASFAIGETLSDGGAEVRLSVDVLTENRLGVNVVADSRVGRADRTLVVHSQLDSPPRSPGINHSGSGSAAVLEIALQLAALTEEGAYPVLNRLRFAWWGAEEPGSFGSAYHVFDLSDTALAEIAASLRLGYLGSPNGVRFVEDGDGSAGGEIAPPGSAFLEWLFRDWFDGRALASEAIPPPYDAFADAGVPGGGLFGGAGGIKTPAQAERHGGEADAPHDPCFHLPCDDVGNIDATLYEEMLDAAANAVGVLAVNTVPAPPSAKRPASEESGERADRLPVTR